MSKYHNIKYAVFWDMLKAKRLYARHLNNFKELTPLQEIMEKMELEIGDKEIDAFIAGRELVNKENLKNQKIKIKKRVRQYEDEK